MALLTGASAAGTSLWAYRSGCYQINVNYGGAAQTFFIVGTTHVSPGFRWRPYRALGFRRDWNVTETKRIPMPVRNPYRIRTFSPDNGFVAAAVLAATG